LADTYNQISAVLRANVYRLRIRHSAFDALTQEDTSFQEFQRLMLFQSLTRAHVSCKSFNYRVSLLIRRGMTYSEEVGIQRKLQLIDRKTEEIREFNAQTNFGHAQIMRRKLDILWTSNSLAIVGNSLSFGDTIYCLEKKLSVEGKPIKDFLEASGHEKAIAIVQNAVDSSRFVSKELLCELNYLLTEHIKSVKDLDPWDRTTRNCALPFTAGHYRQNPIYVLSRHGIIQKYTDTSQIPAEMDNLIHFCNDTSDPEHPIVRAAMAHYDFVRVHPFQCGNRVGAQLLMNLLLIKAGLYPTVISVASRDEYLSALRDADKCDILPLINFVADSSIITLGILLQTIKNELR
jgi:Fic family protein